MTGIAYRTLGAVLLLTAVPAVRAEEHFLESSLAPALRRVEPGENLAADERLGALLVLLEPGPNRGRHPPQPPSAPTAGRTQATAEEVATLFGASPERYARVRTWLRAAGFEVLRDSPHRTAITVSGSVGTFRRAFGVGMRRGRLGDRIVRVPTGVPHVPKALGVRGVIGMDDLRPFRPLHRTRGIVAPGELALDAADFATVYRTATLLAAGERGGGRSIAIVARSNFLDEDIASFATRFTQLAPLPPVRVFATPGVDPGLGAFEDELEVLLDVQWAGAVAPEASVRAVIASVDAGIPEALAVAVEDRVGDVISVSFGLCEPFAGAIVTEFFHELYERATLQGQSVVVASGDAGATDCAPDSAALAINALAASPYAVAVGGTVLDPLFDAEGRATGYGGEQAWGDASGGGGGGVSGMFGSPSYQAGLGFPAGRAIPDLALAASPDGPGYAMVWRGESLVVGGTSAGAPAVAGLLAIAGSMRGEALGHVVPVLYRLGGEQAAAGSAMGAFHDVVTGSNGFAAAPGFDLATGWGSPVGELVVPALAAAEPRSCEPPYTCSIPGGPRADGCLLQWLLPDVPLEIGSRGLPTRTQRCRDGDPCDLDGAVNKSCTIAVSLCFNVLDPRLRREDGRRACAPRLLGSPRIVRPRDTSGPVGVANRRRLEATLAMLPAPIKVRDACTAPTTVEIPVPIGSSFGSVVLQATVPRKRRVAKAKTTLVCERVL
jgi:hypothetical protein